MSKLNVQNSDISSNQEWSADPDMIDVTVDEVLLQKAEKCVAFMQENDIDYMCCRGALGYTLYELAENLDDGDKDGKEIVNGHDGQAYVEFEPEYRLDGCHAKIYKDGDLQAVLPFKHTSDELWFTVGNVADLKLKIAAAAGAEAATA